VELVDFWFFTGTQFIGATLEIENIAVKSEDNCPLLK
jgi:hypothetical protein